MIILFFLYSIVIPPSWAQVTSLDKAPLKRHIKGAEIRLLASETITNTKQAFVGYLTIPAHGKVPVHRDATEEYLFVLSGGGEITIDDKKYKIQPDDLVYMAANAKVSYQNGNKETKVLQIFAGQGPEKKYESSSWRPVQQ